MNIQIDTSDEALVTAIRANMCDFFRLMEKIDHNEYREDANFTRWYSPLSHPWFNGVLSTRPFEEGDDTFIEETVQYFRDKKAGAFTWWMEPHLRPSDWEPALSRHGFAYSDDTPGMAVDLQALNEFVETADSFEVRVVADEESMHIWANLFVKGYGLPSDWEDTVFDLWMKFGFDLPIRNYLGYLNGKPVSTSTLFNGGGAAGIYCVSTLPAARGKGIGSALTLKPLMEARDRGYRIGVLQSSAMGFNVYKKLGFRHLCQIENFYLSLR